jgi:DUF4097 and DUF4098 domain-containing protein YvlB
MGWRDAGDDVSRLATIVSAFVDQVSSGVGDLTAVDTETLTHSAPAALAVETRNGEISVRGEDRDDVRATVTKRATDDATLDSVRVVASGGGDDPLALRVEHDDSRGLAVVDVEVAVPRDVPLASAATKNGRVEVEATTGDADLVTKNGGIEIADHDGSVEVTAKNGSVEARDVTGDLAVAAKNGGVAVHGLGGSLDARTKNGSVEGRVSGLDRAESKSGSIDLDVAALRGDATVATKAGSIDLRVGPDLDADVTLATSTGSIDASAIGASASGLGSVERHGTLGDGGPRLTVESAVGSIEFRRSESRAGIGGE